MDFRRNVNSKRLSFGLLLAGWLIASCAFSQTAWAQWFELTDKAMGTRVHIELWHTDKVAAQRALDAAFREMRRIDDAYSPYQEASELSKVNREAPNGWVKISAELVQLLDMSRRMSDLTGGAFDITFASAGRYYDYRQQESPDAATLAAAVANINYRYVELDAEQSRVRFSQPEVYIDLGGIAKGYAVDLAIEQLLKRGVDQASVTAGGDSRIIGDRGGYPWTVGVRHPREEHELAVRLPLTDTAVSTSGDYERFFIRDGVRYHHILDPQTGASAKDALSVTILGADAAFTDALSTSVFVLGAKRGMQLIDRLQNVDAIIIEPNGDMTYSQGLMGADTAAR